MTLTSSKPAGASPDPAAPAVERVSHSTMLRRGTLSNVGAGAHGEGAPASANCVAARTDLSRGMSPLPAGTEVRAGQPAPPTTTEQSRERTPAGSSNMEVAA